MKPLLILAPAPARWNVIGDLYAQEDPKWIEDLRLRTNEGVDRTQDAAAIWPEGGQASAGAVIRRTGEIGVLAHLLTHPAHRMKGRARALLQTLLSWFDMSGGKWLYACSPADVANGLLAHFGFRVLHRGVDGDAQIACLLRTPAHTPDTPFERLSGEVQFRLATRADLVSLIALLMHHRGPDPRASVAETALGAATTALDLVDQAAAGKCHLVVATRRGRVVGAGTLALEPAGRKTHAMLLPHDQAPPGLRENVLDAARVKGFEQVEFPMDALAPAAASVEQGKTADGEQ